MSTDPARQQLIGKRLSATRAEVTHAGAWAYAQATNDLSPLYRDGVFAPPMFAVVLQMPALMEASKSREVLGDPARFLRLLHGEHDLRWHGALRPGHTYETTPIVQRIADKGSGELIEIKSETREVGHEALVAESVAGLFIRAESKETKAPTGQLTAKPARAEAPVRSHSPDRQLVFQIEEKVAADQSYRYAEASGDHNPIHKDAVVAKAAGLPGMILHGLCSMAFCQKWLIAELCQGRPEPLRRLKVRFSRPVLPGQTLQISAWELERAEGKTSYGLEVRADGVVVLKDCLAEIAG